MRRAILVMLAGCAAAPPTGVWYRVDRSPAGAERLARHDEPAPGRSDGANGIIHGFCPPRFVVFALADGRELALGESCGGATELTVRDHGREDHVTSTYYGAGGTWRAYRADADRVVLVHESTETALLVVDLAAVTIAGLPRPPELVRPKLLRVAVDGRRVFVSGGTVRGVVGSGGCSGPRPSGQGCDPYVIEVESVNHRTYELRLADRASTP